MAKLTEAEQSKIGRRSRRRGKKFERVVAGSYRDWFGNNWQTNRNSGRTDLPGDIYCVDRASMVFVECKHRQNWSVGDILRHNKGYWAEMEKVLGEWKEVVSSYPHAHIWRKDEHGLWVAELWAGRPGDFVKNTSKLSSVFVTGPMFAGPDGVVWRLVERAKENFNVRAIFRHEA